MGAYGNWYGALFENTNPLKEQADEVHGVLPLDLARRAQILFKLFEL